MLFDVKDIVDVSVANASTADVLAKGSKGMFNTASVQLYIYIYIALAWLLTSLQALLPISEPTRIFLATLLLVNGRYSDGNQPLI